MVLLVLSLYGHPVAGNRWDSQMDESVKSVGFVKAPSWKAIYKQPATQAALDVYVDDFEVAASPENTQRIWEDLAKKIEFKEDFHIWGEDPTRHLGCEYRVNGKKDADGHTTMTI